ncbi:hypothetical protein AVEN_6900-1, partial [Araneus ventricosus]
DNNDSTGVMTPPADSAQGPSPTHLYSPAMPDSPRSPQYRDDFNRSPGHEGYSPYSKQEKKMGEGERSQTPTATATGSHWYKPSTRRDAPDQEDYPERQFRGHNRKVIIRIHQRINFKCTLITTIMELDSKFMTSYATLLKQPISTLEISPLSYSCKGWYYDTWSRTLRCTGGMSQLVLFLLLALENSSK